MPLQSTITLVTLFKLFFDPAPLTLFTSSSHLLKHLLHWQPDILTLIYLRSQTLVQNTIVLQLKQCLVVELVKLHLNTPNLYKLYWTCIQFTLFCLKSLKSAKKYVHHENQKSLQGNTDRTVTAYPSQTNFFQWSFYSPLTLNDPTFSF